MWAFAEESNLFGGSREMGRKETWGVVSKADVNWVCGGGYFGVEGIGEENFFLEVDPDGSEAAERNDGQGRGRGE